MQIGEGESHWDGLANTKDECPRILISTPWRYHVQMVLMSSLRVIVVSKGTRENILLGHQDIPNLRMGKLRGYEGANVLFCDLPRLRTVHLAAFHCTVSL